MQAAAQQALANAVQQQVTAIKSATFAKIITITQALALWKKVRSVEEWNLQEFSPSHPPSLTPLPELPSPQARRDRALTAKAALLATVPCTTAPVIHNNFTLDNGISMTINTPRERDVG